MISIQEMNAIRKGEFEPGGTMPLLMAFMGIFEFCDQSFHRALV